MHPDGHLVPCLAAVAADLEIPDEKLAEQSVVTRRRRRMATAKALHHSAVSLLPLRSRFRGLSGRFWRGRQPCMRGRAAAEHDLAVRVRHSVDWATTRPARAPRAGGDGYQLSSHDDEFLLSKKAKGAPKPRPLPEPSPKGTNEQHLARRCLRSAGPSTASFVQEPIVLHERPMLAIFWEADTLTLTRRSNHLQLLAVYLPWQRLLFYRGTAVPYLSGNATAINVAANGGCENLAPQNRAPASTAAG